MEEQAIGFGHPDYSPFENILTDIYERYQRPLFVSETGIEGRSRPSWLRYIAGEVHAAIDAGVPIEGVCIYPILHYPGWEDDRACECGLLGSIDISGRRPVYQPLANELGRQQVILALMFHKEARSARTLSARPGHAAWLLPRCNVDGSPAS